jgi:hypothetical protein
LHLICDCKSGSRQKTVAKDPDEIILVLTKTFRVPKVDRVNQERHPVIRLSNREEHQAVSNMRAMAPAATKSSAPVRHVRPSHFKAGIDLN